MEKCQRQIQCCMGNLAVKESQDRKANVDGSNRIGVDCI